MFVDHYYQNKHSILYFEDATMIQKSNEKLDQPSFRLLISYIDPNHIGGQIKEIQITQPKTAFKIPKAIDAKVKQQQLIMDSSHFDYSQYEKSQGFLNSKFWLNNIFYGNTMDYSQNFHRVKAKLKSQYAALDMIQIHLQAYRDQEAKRKEEDLQRLRDHLLNATMMMRQHQEDQYTFNAFNRDSIEIKQKIQTVKATPVQQKPKTDQELIDDWKQRFQDAESSKLVKPKTQIRIPQAQLRKVEISSKKQVRSFKLNGKTYTQSRSTDRRVKQACPIPKSKTIIKKASK